MARDTQLESLLARLLAGPQLLGADSGSIVACKRSIELQAVDLPFSTIEAASDADIVEHILGSAAVVVVSYTLPMAVARALLDRSHPLLFVLTGPAPTSSTARELMQRGSPVVATLGPHGAIRRTALGHGLASYHSPRLFLRQPGERTGPDDCVGVQIAPTPMWLPELLHHPEFADQPAVCWVEAENLDARWRELRDRPSSTIVVPLGATEPFDVRPRDPAIDVACLAHDCELATGPVAPSPMVTHALLRMLSKPKASESDQASDAWNQVCRVFPSLSKNPEMTEPAVDLRSFDPLSAYIAQLSFARSQRRNKSRAFLRTAHLEVAEAGLKDRALEVLKNAGEVLTDHEAKVVLRGFSIAVTRQAIANSPSAAAQFADKLNYPVAMRVISPDIEYSSRIGAVALNLGQSVAVRRAFAELTDAAKSGAPRARIDGICVAEMVPPGFDIECGAVRLRSGEAGWFSRLRTGEQQRSARTWGRASTDIDHAARFAAAVFDQAHEIGGHAVVAQDSQQAFTTMLTGLAELMQELDGRVQVVHLHPVRLLSQQDRPLVVLDAKIRQRVHLEGL